MKPYIGEWVCENGDGTMTLVIEKVGSNKVTAKYKAVNYEDGRPRTYYTDFEKIQWNNGKFILSYTSYDSNTIIKDVVSLRGNTLTIMFQSWTKTAKGYTLQWEDELVKFYKSW